MPPAHFNMSMDRLLTDMKGATENLRAEESPPPAGGVRGCYCGFSEITGGGVPHNSDGIDVSPVVRYALGYKAWKKGNSIDSGTREGHPDIQLGLGTDWNDSGVCISRDRGSADGPTATQLDRRIQTSFVRLHELKQVKMMVQGMDAKAARNIYVSFVRSTWTYDLLITHLGQPQLKALRSLDARFLAVAATGCSNSPREVSIARALFRLQDPEIIQNVQVHQLVGRLLKVVVNPSATEVQKIRARATLEAARTWPLTVGMLGVEENPWTKTEARRQQE